MNHEIGCQPVQLRGEIDVVDIHNRRLDVLGGRLLPMAAGRDDLESLFLAQALADSCPEITEPAYDHHSHDSTRQITGAAAESHPTRADVANAVEYNNACVQEKSRLLFPPRSIKRAIPPPNFMRVTIVDRGSAIIWSYQRLRRSTKSSISRKRSCTTGSTLLSSRDISTHSRSAAAAGSSSRVLRPAAIRDTRFHKSVSAV